MPSASHPVVFLLGLHGSGKTTLGRLLQDKHGFRHISIGDLGRLARSRRRPADVSLRLMCLLAGQEPGAPLKPALVEHLLSFIDQLRSTSPVSVDGFPSEAGHISLIPPGGLIAHLDVPQEERERRLAARSESGPRHWTPGLLSPRDQALSSVLTAAGTCVLNLDARASVDDLALTVVKAARSQS